jgi:bifunctional oligoribonuclease and PAP phosphatase NrnA
LNEEVIKAIGSLLAAPKRIAILTHVNPDGDALGSALALYNMLIQENHQVDVVIPNMYPSFLAWMPNCPKVLIVEKDEANAIKAVQKAEVIFCLDFNDINRVENIAEYYKKSKAVKILIDHHLDRAPFTDYSISISKISSTSEIIYDFACALNKKHLINKDVAECLYVGIATDTGSFSYACNYEKTYLVTAELFRLGIDGEHIHRLVYDTYSENRMRLLGYCLSEKLKVFHNYHTAYMSLTKSELDRFNYQIGDTEGVVNYALSMEGITLAALFMEMDGYIKVSFRSKGEISVNDLARTYYDGGGHHNASGGGSYISMKETLDQFEKLLPEIWKLKYL